VRKPALAMLALLSATAAVASFAQAQSPAPSGDAAHGRALFVDGCSSCHGFDARGLPGRGPSLAGAGAAAADFYLSTGRMPLDDPNEVPLRAKPAYARGDIADLVAYVGSLGGPAVPAVDPAAGDLNAGFRAFTSHCAGCHQTLARGGIGPGGVAPPLQGDVTSRQVAEAVRVGPYVMPRFSERQIDQGTLDSIARWVQATRHPDDRGGWAIGHIGPITEGMVAWLLAGVALLLVARLIGERTR
jgi:ubiquinol-cytochrome c reductase cytochrome c subunit